MNRFSLEFTRFPAQTTGRSVAFIFFSSQISRQPQVRVD